MLKFKVYGTTAGGVKFCHYDLTQSQIDESLDGELWGDFEKITIEQMGLLDELNVAIHRATNTISNAQVVLKGI